MRTPTIKQKPQKAQVGSFPAPTGGLIANRNLAMSYGPDKPPGAAVMENFFPTASGALLRRGSALKDTIAGGTAIRSIFTYSAGTQVEMFTATDTEVWNTTVVKSLELSAQTGGDWSVVQFATAGGAFLVGVNGKDPAFLYDGTTFDATTITFPALSPLTTADLAYAWVYKQRIWFLEKNTLNAWYLPVDQVGGALTLWPMGGVFVKGGTLIWGQAWSLDSGVAGGLSEQCVFCTTEGEIAAYQGLSPDVDQGWTKVASYRIGRPMGKKAFVRAGGDLVIATTVGFVSLAAAARMDYAALGQNAVSYPIEDAWSQAVLERGQDDWRCQIWPDAHMAIVSPPTPINETPILFVSNTNTGAWAIFTGWDARALDVFKGGLYFGTTDGLLIEAGVGGRDMGMPYVGLVLPMFTDFGTPASIKVLKMARATARSEFPSVLKLSSHSNYMPSFPPSPSTATFPPGSVWEAGIWDASMWDNGRGSIISAEWVSVGGAGSDVSVGMQVTSGSDVPLNLELIRIDVTYATAGIVT